MIAPTTTNRPPETFSSTAAFPVGALVVVVALALPVLVALPFVDVLLPLLVAALPDVDVDAELSVLLSVLLPVVLELALVLAAAVALEVNWLAAEEPTDVTEDGAAEETVLGDEMANWPE